MVPYGDVWYRMVPCMVPYGNVWYHMVPYGTIRYHIVQHGPVWYHMVPYGTIWYHMVPYGTLWYHTAHDIQKKKIEQMTLFQRSKIKNKLASQQRLAPPRGGGIIWYHKVPYATIRYLMVPYFNVKQKSIITRLRIVRFQ